MQKLTLKDERALKKSTNKTSPKVVFTRPWGLRLSTSAL